MDWINIPVFLILRGGSGVVLLLIAAELIAIWLLVSNLMGLAAVINMLNDSKAGKLLKVKATVKLAIPAQTGSSRAVADYTVNERKIRGKMIGKSRERLTEDQTVKILVSEKKTKYFAVEEQQIKNSVISYVIMCLIFLIIAGFLGFLAVKRIIGA